MSYIFFLLGEIMAHRSTHQLSFADFAVNFKQKLNSRLDQISRNINWQPIKTLLSIINNSKRGRRSYPPLLIFKALLIQTWYNLSDYELEESLDDRLSFRRFVGLGIDDNAPDHSTFSIFRRKLEEEGLLEKVFEEINQQLEERGQIVKKGTIVDATLIDSVARKPDQNEDGSGGKSEFDKEAEWVCKGSKRYFGYKVHAAVDADTGIIRKVILTGAKTHDGHILPKILPKESGRVYADKAYESKENSKVLKENGYKNAIMNKASRRVILNKFHHLRNKLISKVRQKVEKTFGTFKKWYGFSRMRYVGIKRSVTQMYLIAIGFNLKKYV
jgi:transposase, IS5 family